MENNSTVVVLGVTVAVVIVSYVLFKQMSGDSPSNDGKAENKKEKNDSKDTSKKENQKDVSVRILYTLKLHI